MDMKHISQESERYRISMYWQDEPI